MIYLLASIVLCFVLYAVSMRLARRIEGQRAEYHRLRDEVERMKREAR